VTAEEVARLVLEMDVYFAAFQEAMMAEMARREERELVQRAMVRRAAAAATIYGGGWHDDVR